MSSGICLYPLQRPIVAEYRHSQKALNLAPIWGVGHTTVLAAALTNLRSIVIPYFLREFIKSKRSPAAHATIAHNTNSYLFCSSVKYQLRRFCRVSKQFNSFACSGKFGKINLVFIGAASAGDVLLSISRKMGEKLTDLFLILLHALDDKPHTACIVFLFLSSLFV